MKKVTGFNLIKIISAVFIFGFCFSSINTKHALAGCLAKSPGMDLCAPLVEVNTSKTAAESSATAASTAAGAASGAATNATSLASFQWDTIGKNTLDAAAYEMGQKLLTKLTDNTVKWIQGGFHGSPSFAVDMEQILTEIADGIAGGLVLSIRNIAVCEFTFNYKDDLMKAVEQSPAQHQYTYNKKAVCPFKQDYTFRASDFYADFEKGGWKLLEASLNDGGNPYGVQMITVQEQTKRENEAIARKNQKLNWAGGFTDTINVTNCNYPADIFWKAGDENPDGITLADGKKSVLSPEQAAAKNKAIFADPARARALQEEYCTTATPGKIVGDQLSKSLGINMDRLGFADNMNKIVAAFINAALEGVVRGVFGAGDRSVTLGLGGGGGGSSSPSLPLSQVPSVNTLPVSVETITKTSAKLNATLIYIGPATLKLRMWFIVRNADSSVPGVKTYEVSNINPDPLVQAKELVALGLTSNTTYVVNTAITTGGVGLLLPTNTSPGNGILGTEVSFRTLK